MPHPQEVRTPRIPARRLLGPSSFDPHDPTLTAIERPPQWHWESCKQALTDFGSKFLLSRIPLFWQIESPLDDVCRAVGVTVFHNEPENMPVGGAAIRSADMDTVITTTEDAEAFVAFLIEKGIQLPRNWFLIHSISAPRKERPAALRAALFNVVEEVHEYPGQPAV